MGCRRNIINLKICLLTQRLDRDGDGVGVIVGVYMLHRPLDVVVDDIDILPADDIAERVFYTVALKQLLDNGVVHAPAADLHELIGIAAGGVSRGL